MPSGTTRRHRRIPRIRSLRILPGMRLAPRRRSIRPARSPKILRYECTNSRKCPPGMPGPIARFRDLIGLSPLRGVRARRPLAKFPRSSSRAIARSASPKAGRSGTRRVAKVAGRRAGGAMRMHHPGRPICGRPGPNLRRSRCQPPRRKPSQAVLPNGRPRHRWQIRRRNQPSWPMSRVRRDRRRQSRSRPPRSWRARAAKAPGRSPPRSTHPPGCARDGGIGRRSVG